MNRRTWLTSLLALPLVPSILCAADSVEKVVPNGFIEILGLGAGGIEFILHDQDATGYSFCVDGDQELS